MQTVKAVVAFLTLSTFMLNGVPSVQWMDNADAQTTAVTSGSTLSTAVPNYTPATMNQLGLATSQVSNAISACDAKGILADVNGLKATPTPSKNAKGKSAMAACLPTLSDTAQASDYKFTCDMKCAAPVSMANLNPKTFCTQPVDGSSGNYKPNGEPALKKDTAEVNKYLYYLGFQTDQCTGNDIKAVQAQVAVYQCKMQALASAEGVAANQLQMALNQNNQSFTKMTQFQNQVKDQMSQIDEVLGPDPTDPNAKSSLGSSGLLAVQADMTKQLGDWNTNEGTFITAVAQIQKDTTTNAQTLQSDMMGQVTDCMKGNTNLGVTGGMSLTCFKPITTMSKDASGNTVSTPATDAAGNVRYSKQPCGALEYVKSQITQAPFRGGLTSASRNDQSQSYGAAFDSMMSSMLRDMGADDTATADGKLVGRTTDWATLSAKYAAQMNQLSAETGVNVASQMQQVATSCYSQGTSWKNQQIKSSASAYNKKQADIATETTKLNSQLNTGLSDMNKEYGSAMGLLANGAAVSLDRSSCTNSDPAKMQACYSTIKQRLQDMMDGTGTVGTTTKPITGGSMIAGFSVACRGINGCVTTYQNIRSQKKTQLTTAAKASEDFVNQGNTTIQNQLQAFAGNLSGLQQQVTASFNAIADKLAALGMTSTAKPKHMDGEPLQTSGGKDGGPSGPYQNPKSMAAVLSGMVQPSGLMDFNDDGTKDLMADVQDQAKSKQEKLAKDLETYQTAQANISSIQGDCNATGDNDGANALQVAGDNDAYQSCQDDLSSCQTQPASGTLANLMSDMSHYVNSEIPSAKSKSMQKRLNDLSNGSGNCDVSACQSFITGTPKQDDKTGNILADQKNAAGLAHP
jgi:hypothetical protein